MTSTFGQDLPPDARVLVTGGSGFIGTNLVRAYLEAGVRVFNLDACEPRDASAREAFRPVDLLDASALEGAVLDVAPSHVFHLAARTDLRGSAVADYAANTMGVDHLLQALRALPTPPERLVVASSRMVCRIGYQPKADDDYCPSTPYGESKVETERIVRATDLPFSWVIGRPTSIWGPWFDTPYRDFFMSVAKRRYVHPRGERLHKNFGFVLNTVDQLHAPAVAPAESVHGRTMYLADEPPIEVLDLANRVSRALGDEPVRSVPMSLLAGVAKLGDAVERTGRTAPLTSFRLTNLLTQMPYDLRPVLEIAGHPRYALDESVPLTVDWMRGQHLV